MLFLDTCIAEANSNTITVSQTFTYTLYPTNGAIYMDNYSESSSVNLSGSYSWTTNSTGTSTSGTNRGSGSITTTGNYQTKGGIRYFDFDLSNSFHPLSSSLLISNFDSQYKYIKVGAWGYNISSNSGSLINKSITFNGSDISGFVYSTKAATQYSPDGNSYYSPNLVFNTHYSYALATSDYFSVGSPLSLTINVSFVLNVADASDDEVASQGVSVTDIGTQNAISEGNEIAQDTNDTSHSILTSITDFFGSFFENLIGIFVPEDGYFSGWFDRVNNLLSDKLGMLYAPFDLVISTLQAIYNADSTESGIPFPGIRWEDTWLIEPFTFTFASLGDSFDDLRDKVYFATDTVLVFTFLMLLQSKVKLILEGHE